jgi:hypothetical protein
MQRQIIHGVPYFIDGENKLYIWEPNGPPEQIGIYNPANESITYNPEHLKGLATHLTLWRSNQHARSRKSKSSNSRRNGDAAHEPEESTEADPNHDES